jgi:hypothetical protein
MLSSAEALELREDLASVEASVADLITTEEADDMAGAGGPWDFGPSLVTADVIEVLEREGCFGEKKVKPPQGEMVSKL